MSKKIENPKKNAGQEIYAVSGKYWNDSKSDSELEIIGNRNGLAVRAKEKYCGDLTSSKYKTNNELFETLRTKLKIDKNLFKGAREAFVLGYSFIFFGFSDTEDISQPNTSPEVPDFIQIIPKPWLKDTEPKDEIYTINKKGGGEIKVHESRLLKIKLNEDEVSSLTPALRALEVADNTLWSSGQKIFRDAAGLLHWTITDPKKVPGTEMNEIEYIKDKGILKKINTQTTFVSDERSTLQNIPLAGTKLDPKSYWDVAVEAVAIAFKIPSQLLTGVAAGQVTGSETNIKNYLNDINKARKIFMDDILPKLAEKFGIEDLTVELEPLTEENAIEKTDIMTKEVSAFNSMHTSGLAEQKSILEHLNKTYNWNLKPGSGVVTPKVATDAAKPYKPNLLPQFKSRLESKKVVNLISKVENKIEELFDESFKFESLEKKIKGSIYIKDWKIGRKAATDADLEASVLILAELNNFIDKLQLMIFEETDNAYKLGLKSAELELKERMIEKIAFSERAKALLEAQKKGVMDLVTGASESMKKDLRFQLNQCLKNKQSVREIAKEFRKYVSADFANQYKNRLKVIAREETVRTFGNASYQGYEDSGVVKKVQCITAGDARVRAEHSAIHGEVVELGKPFSNGKVNVPFDIGCRCDIVPYFDD